MDSSALFQPCCHPLTCLFLLLPVHHGVLEAQQSAISSEHVDYSQHGRVLAGNQLF